MLYIANGRTGSRIRAVRSCILPIFSNPLYFISPAIPSGTGASQNSPLQPSISSRRLDSSYRNREGMSLGLTVYYAGITPSSMLADTSHSTRLSTTPTDRESADRFTSFSGCFCSSCSLLLGTRRLSSSHLLFSPLLLRSLPLLSPDIISASPRTSSILTGDRVRSSSIIVLCCCNAKEVTPRKTGDLGDFERVISTVLDIDARCDACLLSKINHDPAAMFGVMPS